MTIFAFLRNGCSTSLSLINNDDNINIDGWKFTCSQNGWTSNDIALEWFTTMFLPYTKPVDDERRLLIVDGHGSYVSNEFMLEAWNNNVYIIIIFLVLRLERVLPMQTVT